MMGNNTLSFGKVVLGIMSNVQYFFIPIIVIIGVLRIFMTYDDISVTFDEPVHVNYSYRLWEGYGYDIHDTSPALTRITLSAIPYLLGYKYIDNNYENHDVYSIPSNIDLKVFKLARISNIIYFILMCAGVYCLAKSIFNVKTAVISVFIISMEPTVLAHSALATVDPSLLATFILSIYFFTKWMTDKSILNSLLLCISLAFALISKYTAIPFLVISIILIAVCALCYDKKNRERITKTILYFIGIILCTMFIVWSFYKFDIGPLISENAKQILIDKYNVSDKNTLINAGIEYSSKEVFPLNHFIAGALRIASVNNSPNPGYLLSQVYPSGNWMYFPIALCVKTLIINLIFAIVGVFLIVRKYRKSVKWQVFVPIIAVSSIMFIAIISKLNIGVRHILPIYTFMSILSAYSLFYLWNLKCKYKLNKYLIIILLSYTFYSSLQSHPDYISYFNEFAGSHPENILVDSNLDWGQDYDNLKREIQTQGIDEIWVSIFGPYGRMQDDKLGLKLLPPNVKVNGWVAVSYSNIKLTKDYSWLESYTPIKKIGRTILLYRINK